MAVWKLQEAKTSLSEVIEEASKEGPQIIARDDSEIAMVLSPAKYRALTAHKPDLRAYLLGGPKVDDFDMTRDRNTGREVNL
jgi:prevent-host-death family protein